MIELTTSPSKFSRREKAKRWVPYILIVILIATHIVFSSLTWQEMLHRAASVRTVLSLAILLTVMWLAHVSARQSLYITPQYIRYSRHLPVWLGFLSPNWRIERDALVSVVADLGHGSGLKGNWRLRFISKVGKQRSLYLLGWYRLDSDIESQIGDIDEGGTRSDYTDQVSALTVVAALREAGLPILIDAKPAKNSFSNTRVGAIVVSACTLAVFLTIMSLVLWRDLYATYLPWTMILATGGFAGGVTWVGLKRTDMPPENKTVGILAAASLFSLATWAVAPIVNGVTSGGYQDIQYRYEAKGVFRPERRDAPTLDLSQHLTSFDSWRPGDRVSFRLRYGALGFWQYDRDSTLAAIAVKSN